MASRDKADVDTFHKCIQYALEKLGKSKSGFERTVISKLKSKRRVGSGNELVDYSRAPCLSADQKARGLWERDCIFSNAVYHYTCAYIINCFGTGHCSFENENCGLQTDKNATLYWTVDSVQRRKESTAPSYDHAFNKDGKKRLH